MTQEGIAIQSIVYGHTFENISRWLDAANNAVAVLNREFNVAVYIHMGDCSPAPCLDSEQIEQLRESAKDLSHFEYIFFAANLGSARGHNTLAVQSKSDFLMTINPDTVLAPNCLVEQYRLMEDEKTGISEAVQIPLEHPKTFDLETGETSWASTCCAMIRRSAFDAVDGFDSDHFFLHCDDVDFSWMVRLAGFRVRVAPRAIIFHDHGFDDDNQYIAAAAEIRFSALGALMLFAKWGRQDLLEQTLLHFNDNIKDYEQVLKDWKVHEKAGTIPAPLENAGSVSEFFNGAYAMHRW